MNDMTVGSPADASKPIGIGATRRDRAADRDAPNGADAFATILAVTPQARGVGAHGFAYASPNEMFEPPVDDPRDHRLQTMKHEADNPGPSRERGRLAEHRGDRTNRPRSVRSETPPAPPRPGSAALTRNMASSDRQETGRVGGRGAATDRVATRSISAEARVSEGDAMALQRRGSGDGARTAGPSPPHQGRSTPTASSARATSSQGVASASSAGDRSTSPAAHMGRFLAGSRPGDGETVRATTTSNTSDQPRAQRSDRSSAGARQPGRSTAARRGSDSAQAADSARRSAFKRIVRALRLQGGPSRSSARIQLHPPGLGKMDIDVHMVNRGLRLSIETQSTEARDLLYQRVDELRAGLERQGIRIDGFSVTVAASVEVPDTGGLGGRADRGAERRGDRSVSRPSSLSSHAGRDEAPRIGANDGEEESGVVTTTRVDVKA
ncbi:MAG: flagellar hook-length control protein FliK [Planctomycetes bacterium]|nr:flagellar hook-length control protein FliK [Planctomycetota bacterium]